MQQSKQLLERVIGVLSHPAFQGAMAVVAIVIAVIALTSA